MARATGHLRLGAALVGLAVLAGCASPPTRFFTLDPRAPSGAALAPAGPTIRVDHVAIPAVMDRPEMVRERSAAQLTVDDFSHWGAPLGDLVRAALIEDLSARLPNGRVAPAGAPKLEDSVDLTIEITSIREGPNSIVADIDWTLTRRVAPSAGASSTTRVSRHERLKAPLPDPSPKAFAEALSAVTAMLADRIVASTAEPPS